MSKSFIFISFVLLLITGCWDNQGKKFSFSEVERGAFSLTQEEELNQLYAQYVNDKGEIDYENWTENANDMSAVRALVSAIARADVTAMSSSEAKSFYLNAYNILTIDLILRNFSETLGDKLSPYPGKRSIRNINRLDAKVWDEFKWTVGGRKVSLNDIEHKILRPQGDARIHFALVCASKGCPPLLNRSLNPMTLDETLDGLASKFVNSGRDTRLSTNGSVELSSILSWFEEDFRKHFGSVRSFLMKYANTDLARIIEAAPLKYRTYDWTLNDRTSPTSEEGDEDDEGSSSEDDVGSDTEEDVGSGTEEDIGSDTEEDIGSGTEGEIL